MIATPAHSLVFGALDLLGVDHSAGWWIEAAGDDAEFGNPTPVERAIKSFLQDGAIAVVESYDNREMSLKLTVKATSSANLAAAEAALIAEIGKRNTLTWTPPDSTGDFAGTPCVFDIVTSTLAFDLNDVGELDLRRVYTLTLKALPFVRSNTLTTYASAAPPSGGAPTNTLVDDGTSTTNWAGVSSDGGSTTLSTSGGVITLFKGFGAGTATRSITLTRSSLATSMTGTGFVRIKMVTQLTQGGDPKSLAVTVKINGTTVAEVGRDGDYRWYAHPGGTLSTIDITAAGKFPSAAGSVVIRVDEVYRTSVATLSTLTGQRQQFLSLPVGGTVRTQGNLEIADATPTALGTVLVYTTPIDSPAVQPPLRRWRTAGSAETSDATLVSGKYSDLNTLHTFDVPASSVPAGGYLLLARIRNPAGTGYGLAWAGKSLMGTTTLDTAPPHGVTGGNLPVANQWGVVNVGYMTLPTFGLGTSGMVRIELQTTTIGLLLDEAWLFNMDQGQLTWLEAGTAAPTTGGPANRVFIDAASVSNPMPSVWLGTAADRSDAYGAGVVAQSIGEHEFTPPLTNVFVATTNAVSTAVSLSHYPRHHSHVTG